ncbi:High affinity cAMP-specific and IBMX-insensitive 3',5'-cyclic phosphodiesterase 8A [Nowakowskiella sp. JEL0407]|nr:High affinity cAMP-specific and IBMX-insensitive 3',5'-cyclic phosphodiesterase 8A [Nowakowskiella sp. JEL0407]
MAVLENHHCARAFELLTTDPSCNILKSFSPERYKHARSTILSMVLATDMAGHFEFIAKFKNKIAGSGLDFSDPKDRQLVMDIAIKCGDISNAAKPTELCTKWAALIMEEFFRQGDEEKRKGIPVSMFMDRNNTVIPKCQVGFIDYIVTPLYEVWDQYMNEDKKFLALENLHKNREYWKKQQEAELTGIQVG